jgi:dephospho-CoA kinase
MSPKVRYRLIGLTGPNGAGKGEAGAYFAARSYDYLSLSDVIREKLAADGMEATRDNLIWKGNELRRRFGPDILARLIMKKVAGRAVIDSIRNPAEIAYFKRRGGFILLAIDAPVALRYERVAKRGRNESAGTLEEFLAKEAEEKSADPDAQQLDACLALADRVVTNDGTLEAFHRKLEEIL